MSTEQEYDTETMSQSMLDQLDHEQQLPTALDRSSKISFSPNFDPTNRQAFQYQQHNHNPQQLTPHSQDEPTQFATTSAQAHPSDMLDAYGNFAHMIDPDDPMLDADPFGLTASMHYSTTYSHEQQPKR